MKKTTLLAAVVCTMQLAGAQGLIEGRLDNVKKLTNETVRFENPRWSPDGTLISFTGEGYDGLYVMSQNGTNVRKLSDAASVGYMHQWSADSREILVRDTRWIKGTEGIDRVHAAWAIGLNGAKVRLTSDAADMQPAAWRYDQSGAKSIVAPGVTKVQAQLQKMPTALLKTSAVANSNVSYICDCEQLIAVDANGNQRVLNVGPSFCPATSPNGKMVAFNQNDDIIVMNLDGSGKRMLTQGFNASWVNDSQIVFERTTDNGHEYLSGELYLINVDGTGRKALTATDNRIEMNPCVSPDGKRLIFTDNIDGQVYSADLK